MRIYTIWHKGDEGEVPWLLDAVDEYTIDNNGGPPPSYLEHQAKNDVRELILDIPEEAVRALFATPRTKASVVPPG
jgi:hypothetical protein